jgi:hypothetical protein
MTREVGLENKASRQISMVSDSGTLVNKFSMSKEAIQ